MRLTDLLQPEAVFASLRANSKKQLLQELSDKAAHISRLPARQIFDAVLQRERLGSTGIGNGIAIPHAKLAKCPSIIGIFARLEKPVDFEAIDAAPVDLVFLLVAPEIGRRRSFEGLGADCPGSARSGNHREIARHP